MQINSLLDKNAQQYPDKTYLFYKDEEITYKELHRKVNQVAASLRKLGVKEGDRIGLFLRNSPYFIYSWFAINRIGAVIVPINTSYLVDETSFILKNSEAMGIIAEDDVVNTIVEPVLEKCPNIELVISTGDSNEKIASDYSELFESTEEVKYVPRDEEDLASILYTSGTTGNPKGVMCPHRYYKNLGLAILKNLNLTKDDRLLTVLPLFHMNAQTLATMGSLISQSSLVLLERFSASSFWSDVKKYEATIFFYLGSILPVLLKLPITEEEKHNSVKIAVGAQANPERFDEYESRWDLKIVELYGMTEGIGTINPIDERKVSSCGKPFLNLELKIVDENDDKVAPNEVGQIVMRGPTTALGYWKDEENTEETFRDGWVYSGDMGYVDEEGYLYFVDRQKDIIRRSGENISSAEIEAVLMSNPAIVEAAAIPIIDEIRDEEVKVVVVPRDEYPDLSYEEIISWCKERLAPFKIPRYVEFRDELPKTETQKIIKTQLIKESENYLGWDRTIEKERENV